MRSKKFDIREWKKNYLTEAEDLYQVTTKKGDRRHGIPVRDVEAWDKYKKIKYYVKMSKSDAEKKAKENRGWVVQKMTWLKKQKPKGTTHPKDISKMREFEKFANQLENSGWEFKNLPSKYKSMLDKKASDGELAYDQVTGVKNYQDFENWVAHYVTDGKEDWYLLVTMLANGKDEAVKGSPKFRSI